MTRLAIAISLSVAIFGCSDESVCDVEELAQRDVEGVDPVVDCGDYSVGAGTDYPELVAARDCVLDALAEESSFRVTWRYSSFEGPISKAYVGTGLGEDAPHIAQYTRANSVGEPVTSQLTCDDLIPLGECNARLQQGSLCLDCAAPQQKTLCEE